jgi:hypothetical protein
MRKKRTFLPPRLQCREVVCVGEPRWAQRQEPPGAWSSIVVTAVPVSIDPCVLASGHETIFEGSEIEGALGRRRRHTQGGGSEDLLGVGTYHKALVKETSGDRRCAAKSDPWQALQEGHSAQRVVAPPSGGKRRPHSRRARRGFRGGVRAEGLHLHRWESHRQPARWWMAAQKKSQIASERDEEVRGLWRWLASHFDARRLVFVDESGFHTSMTRLRARAPKGKRAYGKVPKNRGKNTTLIAAITLEGAMGESMTVEGATDSYAFSKPTSSTSLHPLFLKGRWWYSMGSGRTGH